MTDDTDDKKRELLASYKRLLAHRDGKDSLLRYIQMQMVDPEKPDDIEASRYEVTPQARLLCEIMEKVERGELKRVAVSIGPQLGKSDVLSRGFPAWASGRNPYRHIMLGTYNQTMAGDFGNDVRTRIQSSAHKAVFPKHRLVKSSVEQLITEEGGKMAFVGAGGSGTGKPADFFVVDDPIRNDEDAQSGLYRDRLWKWFSTVVFTRCHKNSGIVVVQTRWHQDDLIGRLCDPDHPERNKEYKGVADDWLYVNLPAMVEDPELAKALGLVLEVPTDPVVIEQFGSKPMAALWDGKKDLAFLAQAKKLDSRTFNALYMGKPTPDDGAYFKAEMLVPYQANELPERLRMFGASDHAVSEKQGRDYTVLGCIGIDEKDDIWILPDIVWDRMETDRTVEEMILQFKAHKPELWWMEDELISKSFGPFLRKRMAETSTYITLDPVRPSKDKQLRARAIQGRMSMRKVHFPAFAPWWPDAKAQILRFPYGTNDDFVDWLAHIGMGLLKEWKPSVPVVDDNVIPVGSLPWILASTKQRAAREQREKAVAGW